MIECPMLGLNVIGPMGGLGAISKDTLFPFRRFVRRLYISGNLLTHTRIDYSLS